MNPAPEFSWAYLAMAILTPFVVQGIKSMFERLPARWVPVLATTLPEMVNLLILLHTPLEGVYPGLGAGAGLMAIGLREVSVKTWRGTEEDKIANAIQKMPKRL